MKRRTASPIPCRMLSSANVAREKPIPRDLWHALLFYTTGEVVRPVALSTADSALLPRVLATLGMCRMRSAKVSINGAGKIICASSRNIGSPTWTAELRLRTRSPTWSPRCNRPYRVRLVACTRFALWRTPVLALFKVRRKKNPFFQKPEHLANARAKL